jgi:hypothetical protein
MPLAPARASRYAAGAAPHTEAVVRIKSHAPAGSDGKAV